MAADSEIPLAATPVNDGIGMSWVRLLGVASAGAAGGCGSNDFDSGRICRPLLLCTDKRETGNC